MCTVALIDLLHMLLAFVSFAVKTNILLDIKSLCNPIVIPILHCEQAQIIFPPICLSIYHIWGWGGGGQRNRNCRTVGELYLMFRID